MNYKFDTEYYSMLFKTAKFARRLDKAKTVIREALRQITNGYIAFSGGKDSTVLLILVRDFEPDYQAIYRHSDTATPGTLEYVELIRDRYNINLKIIKSEYSSWDFYKKYPERLDGGVHVKTGDAGTGFKNEMNKISYDGCFDGYFCGLRASESQGREYNFKTRGYSYISKDNGLLVCNPLSNWDSEDIFAYLIGNKIPIHPEYFNCKFRPPELLRVGGWTPTVANNKYGQQMRHLQYYHPDLYEKITELRPDLRI